MKNSFLRIGCWLTGYNWALLQACSEVSSSKVRKYTSALVIIILLWFSVGFIFSTRYLQLDLIYATLASIFLCIIVVNLERTIILSIQKNIWLYFFRLFLAVVMATIGSIIIDQAILKVDINIKRALIINERANKVLSDRTLDLRNTNEAIKSEITKAQAERTRIVEALSKKPTIIFNNIRKETVSEAGKSQNSTKLTSESVETENPDAKLLAPIDDKLKQFQADLNQNSQKIEEIHSTILEDLKKNVGFLDEINIMIIILKESLIASIIYTLWFGMLFAIESIIIITKLSNEITDYDLRLEALLKMHKEKIQSYQIVNSESRPVHIR